METQVNTNEMHASGKMRLNIQRMGRFLSGMVMPNIGAFIAWGLITALFIPTGWLPNENLSKLVGPMIIYLLPILIGYTGGKMIGDLRGGVLGAVATAGVIVGADVPMFLGAMIMGPLGGFVMRKVDDMLKDKVPAGFEMLVNNFSVGIMGAVLAVAAYKVIGPVVLSLNLILKGAVETVVNVGLLPIASLVIEPAKILFLNNALNHGVLGPMGMQQATETGRSIFFLLETNPGPGLGLLLAYYVFAKGMIKQSAPGAIIIHFLGGIHEIYFPYVLMNPLLIIPVIAGGASGVFTFALLGAGLVATPSPGSIFALMAMAPRGGLLAVLAGVLVSTAVTFFLSAPIIKARGYAADEEKLEAAKTQLQGMKGKKTETETAIKLNVAVKKIVFACDAGMGSSAMGASTLRNKLKKQGIHVQVSNDAIENIPEDAQIVITHENLTARAKLAAPQAEHISIQDFIENPVYDLLVERLVEIKEKQQESQVKPIGTEELPVLQKKNILLGQRSVEKMEAIKMAGRLLADSGYVAEEYIDAMIQRENDLSTYIGNGIAIPHGVASGRMQIRKTGISILQFPDGVDFGEGLAYLVVGIAGVGNEHLAILSNLASIMEEDEIAERLKTTEDLEYVYTLFTKK
ncbi:PTS system, mannitol-specific IIC component [Geosporobacter subterraneus DSM 17957]|uniref:Mannitol-specific phosphotransferase enzyme IIA component n=1 Tax=Geosporobacter subterraneus DSM 17957 TaxID=1121919 RepID=A0A1M6M7P9_9FIRM|nr:PTS mannitol transporter subunit IICBA [Geosporobacter subterraneus]SHJ79479.1 PTS system, mannitol-specific IIC component [Geosporobacter subterraneus DSM 17957]